MSKYLVIKSFSDMQDNNYKYHVGDYFPHDGLEVSEERYKELSTTANRRGIPLIEKIEELVEEVPEEISEEVPEAIVEDTPKPKKRNKKNAE